MKKLEEQKGTVVDLVAQEFKLHCPMCGEDIELFKEDVLIPLAPSMGIKIMYRCPQCKRRWW